MRGSHVDMLCQTHKPGKPGRGHDDRHLAQGPRFPAEVQSIVTSP